MQDFRKLKVWDKGHELALETYRVTTSYPNDEKYGLVQQLRRASLSIPVNIAEGCGRGSDADFARFVQMAMGSACEVECELLLSRELGFISEKDYEVLLIDVSEVKRMLSALIVRLKS
jgi:four helix bundle protein